MESCEICKKDFRDKRGLFGHYRFVHGIENKGGKLLMMAAPTNATKATKEEIDKINKERELSAADKEKELQHRSLDDEINEVKEEIRQINKEVKVEIKQLNEDAKMEIRQLSEEIKRLNKGVRGVREKSSMGGSGNVAPVVPSTSQEAGGGSDRREEKGALEEKSDDAKGDAFSEVEDLLPRPRRFFRRWMRK